MPSVLLLAYLLLCWHFPVRDRLAVIRSPLLHWRPLLTNLSAYYVLFSSFKLHSLAFSSQTLLVSFSWTFSSIPCKLYSSINWRVFRTICHASTLLADTPILPGHCYRYFAALDFVPLPSKKTCYWKGINYLKLNWNICLLLSFHDLSSI